MCNSQRMLGQALFVLRIVYCVAALPPPDVSNISLTIENNVCADQKPFFALFLVLSHTGNFQERQMIRDVYPAKEMEDELQIRRVFILGSLRNGVEPNKNFKSISDKAILEENEVYADLIQLNSTEEYRKLTLKSLATFTWASKNCQNARFVVKIDDNVVFDYYTAAAHLRAIPDDKVDSIRGYIYKKEPPQRSKNNWKHYTCYEEYFPRYYPDFAATSYVTSPKTLKLLVQTAKRVPFLNSEDVFFTGLVANKANVSRIDDKAYIGSNGAKILNCCVSGRGKVYACKYFLLKDSQYRLGARLLYQKYRNHGRYCYYNKCEPYSKLDKKSDKLVCY